MGGFSAIRNGLCYPETFSCIAALSGAVHIFVMPADAPGRTIFHEDLVFGDLEAAGKTDKNPRVALEALKSRNAPLPKMNMACGLQDGLIDSKPQSPRLFY